MKEILEKIGLSEFFAYVFPGGILLVSLILWVDMKELQGFLGETIVKQNFVVATFILVFSYTLGLIVASWSSSGADLYIRMKRRPQAIRQERRALRVLLWVFHALPDLRFNRSTVEAHLKITEDLTRYSGLQRLSLYESPWDRLVLYRTVMADRVGERGRTILTEADAVHRRFLFSQGVALAFLLLAVQALLRLFLLLTSSDSFFPSAKPFWLVVIVAIGVSASFGLRIAAGRWWEYEFLLTSALTRLERIGEVA